MIQTVNSSMKRNLKIFATGTFLALLFFQVADASYPPVYDVEIIILLNKHAKTSDEDQTITALDYTAGNNRAFPEGEFTELAYKFYQLKDISESLEQSSDYKVLFHRAWRQLAYNSSDAVPYPLDSLVNSESNSVAGSVKLEMESDLYLDVDVLLMTSNIPSDPSSKHPVQQLIKKQRIADDHVYYIYHPTLSLIAKVTPYWKSIKG